MNIARSEDPASGDLHYSDVRIGSKYILPSFPLQFILQLRSYGKGSVLKLSNDSLSKSSLRLDVNADLSQTIKVSLRGEFQRTISQTDGIEKNGSIFGIKIRYDPLEELIISSGISFFTTDSYAARLYSNEADLSGSAPFVALYGKGFRYYLQCSYDIAHVVTLSARAAQTKFAPSPGSPQLQKTSLGLQCDLKF